MKRIGLWLILFLLKITSAYVYNPQDWLNLPTVKIIHSITACPFNIYIGTPEAIFIIDKSENQIRRTLTTSDGIRGVIRICAYDRESNLLWILADNHLIGYNPFTNYHFELFPEFSIRSIGIANSYLYFLTDDKPWRMRKKDRKFQMITKPDTNTIWYGERNTFKVTNYPFLVPYFYLDENLVKYNIRVVFEDRKTLWVGADEYGVLAYDLVTKQLLFHFRLGLDIGNINKIVTLDNNIWFLGNTGFIAYNPMTDQWNYYPTPFGSIFSTKSVLLQPKILDLRRIQGISSIWQAQDNYWLSSGNQIYHYDLKTNTLTPILRFPTTIQKVLPDEDKIYFIAGNHLYCYQTKNSVRIDTIFDPYQKIVFGVFDCLKQLKAGAGIFYFSVYGGFLSLNSVGIWQLHIPPGIDFSLPFTSLAGFGDYLFLGSANGVIAYNQETERYDYFTKNEGLLSNNVTALYADSNYLWIATDRGVSRFTYRNVLPR
uniref:WD40 repeat domain-containing protein n=1 Tax=candidate division WOR-3 bacterium TaxID=2052148 RepID=A0A7C6ED99_UNCW3